MYIWEKMNDVMAILIHSERVLTVFAREERLSFEHLSKNTPGTPDIDCNIVFLPCEHNFGRPVVPSRDISGHLRILNTREAEITDLETRQ